MKNEALKPASSSLAPRAFVIKTGISLAAAAFTICLAIGSWGFDDWFGFVSHPARVIALGALCLRALSLPWFQAAAARSAAQPGKAVVEPVFFVPIFAGALLSLLSPYFDRRGLMTLPLAEWVRSGGLLLFIAGVFVASWAQWHMGRLFSGHLIIQKDHHLITDGPFSWVRHPRYAGLILVFIGWPMVFRSWVGMAGGLVCAVMFLIRIPREEALLAREFKTEWDAYTRQTMRLLPGIY